MDRRTALKLLPASIGATACGRASIGPAYLFQSANLAIIDRFGSARTPTGTVGRLGHPGSPPIIGVAPNARELAMLNYWAPDAGFLPRPYLVMKSTSGPGGAFVAPYGFNNVVRSSAGSIFATLYEAGSVPQLVRIVDAQTWIPIAEVPIDIHTLGTSDDGQTIMIGTSERWSLIDTRSKRIVRRGLGRSASLSPDGKRIAYVTADNRLVAGPIYGRLEPFASEHRVFWGVGSWSPDGKWLLAGGTRMQTHVFGIDLYAANMTSGEVSSLWSIGYEWGNRCFWIDRSLLDPA